MLRKLLRILLIAFFAIFTITSVVTTASAASYGVDDKGNKCVYSHKKPSKKSKYKQCKGQVDQKTKTKTSTKKNPFLAAMEAGASVAGAESSASSSVTVLSYIQAKGLTKKQLRGAKCRRISAGTGYWNSGRGTNGKVRWFWDTRAGTVCKLKNGVEYRKECGNRVRTKKPKKNVVKGNVKLVKSFGRFSASASASEKVRVEGVCGYAEAEASAKASARGLTRAQARGNARINASGKAVAKASAKASAMIHCAPTKVVPSNPQYPPTFVCSNGQIVISIANCIVQSNSAEQNCKAIGGTFNGSNQLCTIVQVNANCSNVIIVNGSGNVVNNYQEGNCNVTQPPAPPEPPAGGKDGTTTPPPPTTAPGPNPPPSGGTGDPGSNKCYSEVTGLPVPPMSDGRCPVGSYGG